MSTPPPEIVPQLNRIINKLIFLEKRTIFRYGPLKLFPSEIHLMQLVAQEPGLNATQMAQRLGITKGAVSQTVSRLVKKGALLKSKDPASKNQLSASFTARGKKALERFAQQQAGLQSHYAGYLAGLSAAERKLIGDFLSRLEGFLQNLA